MPTSSQALILLTSDGRITSQYVPHRTFPLSSVPYPLTNNDFSAACVEVDDNQDDVMGDVLVTRQTRIKFGDILSNLPNMLTIKGYQGALAYDVNSKVMKWQVDTEVPSSRMEAFITYRGDPAFKPDYFQEDKSRLPPIYGNGGYRYSGDWRAPNGTQGCMYTQKVWRPPSEQLENMPLSFPSFIKTEIDEKTYERLCNLGFRPKDKMKQTQKKANDNQDKQHRKRTPSPVWENPEEYQEKDFRLEDLNLRPNGKNMYCMKMSHLRQDGNSLPVPGNMEPMAFLDRQRNPVSFNRTGNTVFIPGREAAVVYNGHDSGQEVTYNGHGTEQEVTYNSHYPGQEVTYNGHGPSSMEVYMAERNKFFSKYGKFTSGIPPEESHGPSQDNVLPVIVGRNEA